MTDQEYVLSRHPGAWATYFIGTSEGWKIYADRVRFIALSGLFDMAADAWADAAKRLRERGVTT